MSKLTFEQEKEKTFNKVHIHELINFDKTTTQPKVSIIIPVCNVEEYLFQCVESALEQTLDDIEIICVNDGSTDSSLSILKEFASKDPRVKIIDKDNAGYGHSMNIGMDMASGEYIGILESDDYVLPDMFRTLYETAKENDLDFVKSDFYRFYGEGEKLKTEYNRVARTENNYNTIIYPKEDQQCFKFIMNTWCGIYNTEFLRKNIIRHNETPGASYQDNGFWFKTNVFAKRTMYIPEAFYMNRRDNPNSSVYNPEKVYCANTEYQLIYEFLEEYNIKEDFLEVYNYKKYHTYMFTLKRIAPKFRKEYIQSLSKEFREFDEKGELKTRHLSSIEWNKIKWIMRDPLEYYYEVERKNIKVSVILPVYNVEKYLQKCLDSLINQTLRDIEIICINDGSTDNCLEILQEYSNKDHRIKVINQENKGAAVARNIGITMAQGEYLSFLDADDFFDKNMLKKAYQKSITENSDICIFESNLYDNITHKTQKCTWGVRLNELPKKNVFNRRDVKSNIFKSIMGWAWDKLYKKSFVLNNKLQFQDQRTTNDMYFVFASLLKAGRITILQETLYYHRRNDPDSLSNTRELSWDCFYHALIKVRDELIKMELYEEYENDFVNYALHSCLWNFNTLTEPYAYKLFIKLRHEWFDELGINGHPSEFFKNKTEYNQYIQINNIPDMISDDKEAYNIYQINYWKNKAQHGNPKSVMDIEVRIDEHETLTVREMRDKITKTRNEKNRSKSNEKLRDILNSKAYKLSLIISWLPRKIKDPKYNRKQEIRKLQQNKIKNSDKLIKEIENSKSYKISKKLL